MKGNWSHIFNVMESVLGRKNNWSAKVGTKYETSGGWSERLRRSRDTVKSSITTKCHGNIYSECDGKTMENWYLSFERKFVKKKIFVRIAILLFEVILLSRQILNIKRRYQVCNSFHIWKAQKFRSEMLIGSQQCTDGI